MKQESRENITEGSDEGFLSRWSRLKQNPPEEPAESAQEEMSQHAEQAAVDAAALEDDEVSQLTDEDMPPLESLDEDSDYSGFMSPKVSDGLRRLALRKLFHSSSFNVLDGLNDYDEDFTSFAKLGDIVTCDMKFQTEQEELKKAREALQADSEISVETSAEADLNEEQQVQAADEPGVEPSVAEEQTLAAADDESDSHIVASRGDAIEDDFDDDAENFLDDEPDEEEIAG